MLGEQLGNVENNGRATGSIAIMIASKKSRLVNLNPPIA